MKVYETCIHYCGDEDCAKCDKYGILTGGCAGCNSFSDIVRNCETCTHRRVLSLLPNLDTYGCELWECDYERKDEEVAKCSVRTER